jgi:hypothetical protein
MESIKSINSILNEYLNFLNSYLNPTKISSTNDSQNNKSTKIKTLINEITGDGNLNSNKIIGVKALISEEVPNEPKDKSYQKQTMHQFYSPSNEF